ncbi:MAG: MFS transporter, partial [Oscillospiraceae bacterium]|nr:MFS transporter [Oscillospiraceae bacterium]
MKSKKLVSVIGCLAVMVCVGIIYLWSVLKQDCMDYYGWTLSEANLVASVMMFAFCVGNFGGGALNDKFGAKKVSFLGVILFGVGILLASLLPQGSSVWLFYLTYSVIGGVGVGIAYGAILSCIQKWYPHKRGFATGLATAFFGLSTVVFSLIIGNILKSGKMAVNTCLLVLSIVFLVVGLVCCTLIGQP